MKTLLLWTLGRLIVMEEDGSVHISTCFAERIMMTYAEDF